MNEAFVILFTVIFYKITALFNIQSMSTCVSLDINQKLLDRTEQKKKPGYPKRVLI